MSDWAEEDLQAIATSDDLHVSPFRADGTTYGTPTWIWSVVVGDELYVRACNGTASRWYVAAAEQRAGRIRAGGGQYEVGFTPVDDEAVNDAVDEAYRSKYAGSQYLPPMLTEKTRAATVRIDLASTPAA